MSDVPDQTAPTRVFLSYARGDDEPFVRRLHGDLAQAGFQVWFDRESLMSRGLSFHQEIKDAIRTEVDRLVYVGGPKAALSANVREEWQFALECDHVVVTPVVRLGGDLAKARCKTQVDVGFGDAVTPAPVDLVYPVLLDDLPAPRLRTYPVYTVVAEKLHAIALLGMTNSRMKDYLDLSVVLERESLDMDLLAQAVKATFERRGMALPAALPVGLTDEFAHDTSRQALWQAFLKKNELAPEPLAAVVVRLRATLEPALNLAAR